MYVLLLRCCFVLVWIGLGWFTRMCFLVWFGLVFESERTTTTTGGHSHIQVGSWALTTLWAYPFCYWIGVALGDSIRIGMGLILFSAAAAACAPPSSVRAAHVTV